ncbi:MAG: glycosyltransferase, partial [Pseudomonadota bacterium]
MDCQLSVILCTYNPNRELLAKALAAVAAQSLARDRFELIVIDNNSSPALQEDDLAALSGGPVRLVRELRQGLTFARACGLKTASSERICFIDDDNEIAPDFFETALAIFWAEPRLGVFGGVAEGALGRSVGPLKTAFLPHLGVRDMGADDMTGSGAAWGPWEPIGAGLCLRAEVGEGYVAYVEGEGAAGGLGRQGGALLSGEDSLISRIAHCQGFLCGYRPKLRLRHHIGAGRLTYGY